MRILGALAVAMLWLVLRARRQEGRHAGAAVRTTMGTTRTRPM